MKRIAVLGGEPISINHRERPNIGRALAVIEERVVALSLYANAATVVFYKLAVALDIETHIVAMDDVPENLALLAGALPRTVKRRRNSWRHRQNQ
jgi:hypothetical protein